VCLDRTHTTPRLISQNRHTQDLTQGINSTLPRRPRAPAGASGASSCGQLSSDTVPGFGGYTESPTPSSAQRKEPPGGTSVAPFGAGGAGEVRMGCRELRTPILLQLAYSCACALFKSPRGAPPKNRFPHFFTLANYIFTCVRAGWVLLLACLLQVRTGTSGQGSMSDEIDRHVLRRYETVQKLGKGAYGIVWKANDKKRRPASGHPHVVALKKIFDAFQNATDAQRTFREIEFLQEMNGQDNIIQLLDVLKADNDKDIYLVFEFMETDLHASIRANILQDIHKQYIIWQLLKAIKFMHSANLLHRDIKPSNLLLNSDCTVKVCDFGLARSATQKMGSTSDDAEPVALTDYVATRWYRAPEILLGARDYGFAVDMWAVGCILGEMINGKPIVPGSSTINQIEKIVELSGVPSDAELDAISSFAKTMFSSLSTRASAAPDEVRRRFQATFRNATPDALDLLLKLLAFNPQQRPSAEAALGHAYVAQFHNPMLEMTASFKVKPSTDDNTKMTTAHYRNELYQQIRDGKFYRGQGTGTDRGYAPA
jgi:mitogen-activated protein kinase 15